MKSLLVPVFLFALSMTVTPGPNNMLLTATGARFGYRRTLPMITGIVLGIVSQLCLSALGLGFIFSIYPLTGQILKAAGSLYILYLAWTIAFRGRAGTRKKTGDRPLGLIQGALFQYLNPKAYIMTITAMSVYPLQGEYYLRSTLLIIGIFALLAPFSISLWAAFGSLLGKLMNQSRYSRAVNLFLGGLTAVSVVFIIIP